MVLKPMKVKRPHSHKKKDDDQTCAICQDDYDYKKGVVRVPCAGKHKFDLECLLQVLKAEGPENAKCPMCRELIIRDLKTIDKLKYGTEGKKYIADDRFSSWENEERSLADLDKHLAGDTEDQITVNSILLNYIFQNLIEGAFKERSWSRPHHLQPARSKELPLLMKAITFVGVLTEGRKLPMKNINRAIILQLKQNVINACCKNGIVPSFEKSGVESFRQYQNMMIGHFLRPDFMPFARRVVSRMLQFVLLRRCRCKETHLFHNHGGRQYYNPSLAATLLPRKDGRSDGARHRENYWTRFRGERNARDIEG